jgi:hypothetical protein
MIFYLISVILQTDSIRKSWKYKQTEENRSGNGSETCQKTCYWTDNLNFWLEPMQESESQQILNFLIKYAYHLKGKYKFGQINLHTYLNVRCKLVLWSIFYGYLNQHK